MRAAQMRVSRHERWGAAHAAAGVQQKLPLQARAAVVTCGGSKRDTALHGCRSTTKVEQQLELRHARVGSAATTSLAAWTQRARSGGEADRAAHATAVVTRRAPPGREGS